MICGCGTFPAVIANILETNVVFFQCAAKIFIDRSTNIFDMSIAWIGRRESKQKRVILRHTLDTSNGQASATVEPLPQASQRRAGFADCRGPAGPGAGGKSAETSPWPAAAKILRTMRQAGPQRAQDGEARPDPRI